MYVNSNRKTKESENILYYNIYNIHNINSRIMRVYSRMNGSTVIKRVSIREESANIHNILNKIDGLFRYSKIHSHICSCPGTHTRIYIVLKPLMEKVVRIL